MGNNTTLDRDRAFDINNLNELLTQGTAILTQAIAISQKMEASVSAISGVYGGIDEGYKVAALGTAVNSLSGKLYKDIYQDTINSMDRTLNKLIDNMPAYDSQLAKGLEGIEEVFGSIRGRISELQGLLEAGIIEQNYKEFSQRLAELKTGWDNTTEDLAELLAGIENDMLGVSVRAVLYSSDPVNLSTGNFVYDHEDIAIRGEIPLSFHRYYNSKARSKGSLGRCFVHNYEICLEEDAEKGKITISMEDGQKKTFRKKEDGSFQSLYSAVETLKKEGEDYVLTDPAGQRTVFDGAGRLVRRENRYGRGDHVHP